ncbi:MAG: O-antigen ligase family protein [Planctomycetaceae bacterium]|nr:O-antigen ligase family protein [Planctomycetaceae bacterium]
MNILANLIRTSLLLVLFVTPWLFGGVWASVQWVLLLILAILLAADLMSRFRHEKRLNLIPTAWIPLLIGIGLGTFQLIPWAPSLATLFAAESQKWHQEFNEPLPTDTLESSSTPAFGMRANRTTTRSLYTVATREYLALLCLATAVLVLSSLHFVDGQSILWLCLSSAVLGTGISFFGLIQRLSWNGKFYWIFEPMYGGWESFGPFVNRNNAGGFLNLCLAGAIGFLIWTHGKHLDESTETSQPSGRHRSRSRHRSSRGKTDRTGQSTEATSKSSRSPSERFSQDSKKTDKDSVRHQREKVIYPSDTHSSRSKFTRNSFTPAISKYLSELDAARLGAIILVAFVVGGVFCTASRGSILAMFAATMATVTSLAMRRGSRKYAVGLLFVMVAGLGLMGWAGQSDFVKLRFEKIVTDKQYETGRVPNWLEALETVPDFWAAGTGLGTYRFVYERFQHRYLSDISHFHAENQYIQALVEGGVIALFLLLAAIGLVIIAITKLYRASGITNTVLAVTGTFALTSQAVGGSFDFGLYIPSNTMLMASICGAVIGRAALLTIWPSHDLDRTYPGGVDDRDSGSSGSIKSTRPTLPSEDDEVIQGTAHGSSARRSRKHVGDGRQQQHSTSSGLIAFKAPNSFIALIIGLLGLGCLFGSLELNKAAKIAVAMREASLDTISQMDDPEKISDAMSNLIKVLPQRWDDALAHRRAAAILMQLYQAETYQQLLGEKLSKPEPRPDEQATSPPNNESSRDEDLWRRSSVWHLHGTIHDLLRKGDHQAVDLLLRQPTVKDRLVPAMKHVTIARDAACTIPQLHYMVAELLASNAPNVDDQIYLDRARTLAPGDASLWYWSGLLELNNDRKDAACQSWHHSLTLSDVHLDDIIENARGKLTLRDLLEKVLPKRSDILLKVVQRNFLGHDKAKVRNIFLQRAEEFIETTDLPSAQMAYVKGSIYGLQGRTTEAVAELKQAVTLDSSQLNWRFEYAQRLLELEELEEALNQVKILQSERPSRGVYQRLRKEINRKRYRVGAPDTK